MHITVALIVALMVLPACSSRPPAAASHEFLDEQTGTTLSVVAKALVFGCVGRPAVLVESSGKYNEYLLLYRWSTVDPRMSPAPDAHAGELKILADGRVSDLTPLGPGRGIL